MNKKSILYVDDEPMNLELFKINYKNDFQVYTGLSGNEGLNILKEHNEIDVVFSDMKMPEMNGIEFISSVKSKYPEMPCLILTGYDITNDIRTALDNNLIKKYYQKPLNFKQIKEDISEFIKN